METFTFNSHQMLLPLNKIEDAAVFQPETFLLKTPPQDCFFPDKPLTHPTGEPGRSRWVI